MYIIKNAFKSITRSKGRNILIGIIVFVIAISACTALSIRQAANTAKQKYLDDVKITAQISVDRSKLLKNSNSGGSTTDRSAMMKALNAVSELSVDDLQKYAKAESVEDFYYTITSSLDAGDGLNPVDTTDTDSSGTSSTSSSTNKTNNSNKGMPEGGGGGSFGRMGSQGDFTVIGYSSDEAMTGFTDGTNKITSGTVFVEGQADNTCVISEELATYNSLKVGDTIKLKNPNKDTEVISLKVCGIYKDSSTTDTSSQTMGGFSASQDPANKILTSYATLKAVTTTSAKNATTSTDEDTGRTTTDAIREQTAGTYTFATKADYDKFDSQVRALGLSDSYAVSSQDLTSYEQSLKPLESLSDFATYFFLVVLAIGAVILVVLNIFNIRERKYEIGVLAAIGMKKLKIASQYTIELFIVTVLAIIIGTGIGASVSVPVTNALLASQITATQQQTQTVGQNFGRDFGGAAGAMAGGPSVSNRGGFMSASVDYVSQINSATNLTVVLQLMAIGILLTIIASSVAVAFVLRYDPLKILSNRE